LDIEGNKWVSVTERKTPNNYVRNRLEKPKLKNEVRIRQELTTVTCIGRRDSIQPEKDHHNLLTVAVKRQGRNHKSPEHLSGKVSLPGDPEKRGSRSNPAN